MDPVPSMTQFTTHINLTTRMADQLLELTQKFRLHIETLTAQLAGLESTLSTLESRISTLERRQTQVETWVASTRTALDTLGAQFDHHVHPGGDSSTRTPFLEWTQDKDPRQHGG